MYVCRGMYVCMYVCMHVCVCVYVCIYVHTYGCVSMHVCMCIHMLCMYACHREIERDDSIESNTRVKAQTINPNVCPSIELIKVDPGETFGGHFVPGTLPSCAVLGDRCSSSCIVKASLHVLRPTHLPCITQNIKGKTTMYAPTFL